MNFAPTTYGLHPYGLRPYARFAGGGPAPPPPPPFAVELVGHLDRALPAVAAYPGRLPQTGVTLPALTFQRLGAARPLRLSGSSGVVVERYQFDVWSDDALDAATAAEGLRRALQNYRGPMGTAYVFSINVGDALTGYEPPIDSSDVGRFRETVEASVARRESIGRPAPA